MKLLIIIFTLLFISAVAGWIATPSSKAREDCLKIQSLDTCEHYIK